LEPAEVQPSLPSGLPAPVATSLDAISKSVAVFAILLYGCGYLITSIYYSGYGFTETSPLRPRIVTAGAWFLLFTVVPFALVKGVSKSKEYLKADGEWWYKVPTFLFLYFFACVLPASQAWWIFDLDAYTVTGSPSQVQWWQVLAAVGLLILAILVSMVFSWKGGSHTP